MAENAHNPERKDPVSKAPNNPNSYINSDLIGGKNGFIPLQFPGNGPPDDWDEGDVLCADFTIRSVSNSYDGWLGNIGDRRVIGYRRASPLELPKPDLAISRDDLAQHGLTIDAPGAVQITIEGDQIAITTGAHRIEIDADMVRIATER